MIAVFTKSYREFKRNFNFKPKKLFIHIGSEEDIRGRWFIGVIEYTGWVDDPSVIRAYDLLKRRQPELFSNEFQEQKG